MRPPCNPDDVACAGACACECVFTVACDACQSTIATVDKSVTKLLYAAYDGDLTMLQRLVADGFDVNATDYDARTALHLAAAEGHEDAVRYLVSVGSSATAADRFGHTPIDSARNHGHENLVKILTAVLENPSDPANHVTPEMEPVAMAYRSLATDGSGNVLFQAPHITIPSISAPRARIPVRHSQWPRRI